MKTSILYPVFATVAPLLPLIAPAEELPPLFPFVTEYSLAQGGPADVSALLDAPAGKHGFIRCENGRFVHNAGEFRVWGTNLSGDSNFPENAYADAMAARLAALGINCVRLHWMDGYALWGPNPATLRKIDPAQFDKLDYLVAALKKRGIYVNLNLHVARWLDDRDGFLHKDKRPKYDKGLDNFEPRLIEFQKEFARDFLTHRNPYTGLAYTDEPAIAMLEINNENSVMSEWANGDLDDLPDPYGAEFQKQWNAWLKGKYGTDAVLLAAWKCRNVPLGEEMLQGGAFTQPVEFNRKNWILQLDDDRHADCEVIPAEKLLRITTHRDGQVNWTPQLYYRNLTVKKGEPYTLSFRVRSGRPVRLYASVYMDKAPWTGLGMRSAVDATPEWKTCTFRFRAAEDCDFARVSFSGIKTGTLEFAELSLRPGGQFGVPDGCALEKGNIPPARNREQELSAEHYQDFWCFLFDIEQKYWGGMYRFLKDELKAKQSVSGTQLYYGSKVVQASLDYCDDHAYWNHPAWPVKAWDAADWFIRNRALVNWADTDIFVRLATRRIAGKPYTVSEYNHPFPNRFAAEGLLMLSAFARFQGWDGVFQYTYAHRADIEPKQVTGYFDMIAQQGQLVHSPACAAMLLRGDVSQAKRTVRGALNRESEWAALAKHRWPSLVGPADFGLSDRRAALLHSAVLDVSGGAGTPKEAQPDIPQEQAEFVSDTRELTWNVGGGRPEERDAGYFTLNTPKTKVFTGFIKGRTFGIGGAEFVFGKTRLDWATVSVTETKPGRFLVAATGLMENSGMKFEPYASGDPKNGDKMTLRRNWGGEPVLCEGIPLTLALPLNIAECHALDTAGKRKQAVPVKERDGKSVVVLKPEYQTLWYEVVAE
jgi:hypothetical protein